MEIRPSCDHGISYAGKTSLYWIRVQGNLLVRPDWYPYRLNKCSADEYVTCYLCSVTAILSPIWQLPPWTLLPPRVILSGLTQLMRYSHDHPRLWCVQPWERDLRSQVDYKANSIQLWPWKINVRFIQGSVIDLLSDSIAYLDMATEPTAD